MNVEEALKTHPDVEDALVVGVPDEKWGQAVTAVVEMSRGTDLDEGSLRQYVRRHSLDFESRSPSGRLRRSSVDAIPSLDSISETPATADVAD